MEKLDLYTVGIVFDLFYNCLPQTQRKDYIITLNDIIKFLKYESIVVENVYQITIDDLETILKNFKI
ncbi:hypothetical protein LCGC14_1176990 [marine sediment metagenome]|uniref:Uncharacterized protein n=1 Tax=marine sediment metagenome TaxID=412755 RepID=A0A0F9LT43_9ZZZZ